MKYSKNIIVIHWFSFVLILGLIFTGIKSEEMIASLDKILFYKIHFSIGLIVLMLTTLRVYFYIKDKRPSKNEKISQSQYKFIKVVYILFYIVLLALGFTGITAVFIDKIYLPIQTGLISDFPKQHSFIFFSHHILTKVFFLLLIIHLVGFITHLIRFKENTIKRIS